VRPPPVGLRLASARSCLAALRPCLARRRPQVEFLKFKEGARANGEPKSLADYEAYSRGGEKLSDEEKGKLEVRAGAGAGAAAAAAAAAG
jgi:hypothetical protein